MTAEQIEGYELLIDHTVCDNCHAPPLFTDNAYHNIGLRPADEDAGRMEVTGHAVDYGRFKTPSLRNVGLRGALMHVGWIRDTQDAIDFYNAGQLVTGHVQFTQDQTGIPTQTPGQFSDYSNLLMPEATQNGIPFQTRVIDFVENGLTDPRVAHEEFPFDRPILRSEVPEPGTFPLGVAAVAVLAGLRRARTRKENSRLACSSIARK